MRKGKVLKVGDKVKVTDNHWNKVYQGKVGTVLEVLSKGYANSGRYAVNLGIYGGKARKIFWGTELQYIWW